MKNIKFILVCVAVFGFQEVVFRVAFPLPDLSNFDRGLYVPKIGDEPKGYTRNRSYFWQSKLDTIKRFVHRYNLYGFRDDNWKLSPSQHKKRVLFLGDSFVESIMSDSTMTEYFQSFGNEESLEVMNAGMLGTGISRYLRLMSDMVPVFKPKTVVLVVYANDLMYDRVEVPTHYLEPEYYSKYKPRVFELIQQWKQGKAVPFRFFQSPELLFREPQNVIENFDNIYQEHRDSKHKKALLAIARGDLNPTRLNELQREEQYLRKPFDFRLPIDYFKYYSINFGFEPIVVFIPSRNQITDNYLTEEKELCPECGQQFSLMESQYNQNQIRLAQVCDSLNVTFMDVSSLMKVHEAQGENLYFAYDNHLNEAGTKLIGQEIRKFYNELQVD